MDHDAVGAPLGHVGAGSQEALRRARADEAARPMALTGELGKLEP